MAKRTVDLLTEAYKDVMSVRRKYELKAPDGSVLKELYFPPLSRADRIRAQNSIKETDGLAISTALLCQTAQNENGTKAFHIADAEELKMFLPESVLNDLEIFMMDIKTDLEEAKKESGEITG